MAPEQNLINFMLGKELKLLSTRTHRRGFIWECEKLRAAGEVCPRCATLSTAQSGVAWTTVREEDLRGQPLWLKIKKHRYMCKTCRRPFTEPVSGIMPGRRTTQRLRKKIVRDCDDFTNLARVSRRHFCSRSLVGKICYEQLEIKLRERLTARWPKVLGIDEHRFKKGKNGFAEFVTMLTDVGKKKIFELAETRKNETLIKNLEHIPGRQNVEFVVMDLCRGYRKFAMTVFSQAKIIADKFHVLRLLNPSLIRERARIHGARQELHLRRKLLMNRPKLEYFERSDLDHYLKNHPKLNELYRYKESLHQLYRTKGYNRAKWALEKLIEQMQSSEFAEIQTLRRTLKQWQDPILEYFRARFTNGFTECMNRIAKLVQRRGCGYRNFRNYRLRTLSACPS